MTTKRSTGITIFGYLCLIPGVIILTLDSLTLLLVTVTKKTVIITSNFGHFLTGIIIGFICVLCGMGLLKLRKWGLKLFICLSVSGIIYGAYGLWYKLYYLMLYGKLWITINVLLILLQVFVIWFFTRKDIVEQFRR